MADYIGAYVKKFESGSTGSLNLGSCGNDWGLSCGSYQLTLRWGNCINFLKKFFPSQASGLFFNSSMKDFASKTWPGNAYCSSPDAVKSVWQKAYNSVGSAKFFEYEHTWIQSQYYDIIKSKIKSILDLDTCGERAFQECFWAWSVHRGAGGAYSEFSAVLSENKITSLDYIDKEFLFDAIYDKRYATTKLNRYKKGLMNGDSERETLRPLLGKGTFSGKVQAPVEEECADCGIQSQLDEIMDSWVVNPLNGTLKVILRNDVLNIRKAPTIADNIVKTVSYGDVLAVVGKVENRDFYELDYGMYVSSNPSYVQFTPKESVSSYTVRIKVDTVEIKKDATNTSATVGAVRKNEVYTIVDEKNGYGKLKSGAGWISLSSNLVTRLS